MSAGRGKQGRGGAPLPAEYTLQDLTRRVLNVLRYGRVVDIDEQAGAVRVQTGTEAGDIVVTGWITAAVGSAGGDREAGGVPELDEQVLLGCVGGRLENARILARIPQDLFPSTSGDPNDVMQLYRVLEGTTYWHAAHRRRAVGQVDPQRRKEAKAVKLNTMPPKDKTVANDRETPEILEMYDEQYVRADVVAAIVRAAFSTQANGQAVNQLVATCVAGGLADVLVEASNLGDGDAVLQLVAKSGMSTHTTEQNPHKQNAVSRSGGSAIVRTGAQVQGPGDAESYDDVVAPQGRAIKVININGSESSELEINLTNVPKLTINIGAEQQITADGTRMTVKSKQVLIEAEFGKMVGDWILDGNLDVTGTVSDAVRAMSDDRDIYNQHGHPVSGSKALPTDKKQ